MEGKERHRGRQDHLGSFPSRLETSEPKNTPVQESMNYIHAALHLCTDLRRSGCVVAWLVANADKVSQAWPSALFLDKLATSDAWQRAAT